MPELAEVEYQRKQWEPGLGQPVLAVDLHPHARVFRGCDTARLKNHLVGTPLSSSEASGKQMLFRFGDDHWLGIHLGMTGSLRCEPAGYRPQRHDHLVLHQQNHSLVFADPRMIGRLRFATADTAPDWWTALAPAINSAAFTVQAVAAFLRRHSRSPIKSVLLLQDRFPGVGNWMADEILWRAGIHPRRRSGSLSDTEIKTLRRECRWVCREALRITGASFADPPATWLFPHRWSEGGFCPKTGARLVREPVGGRTTCWSPGRQRL